MNIEYIGKPILIVKSEPKPDWWVFIMLCVCASFLAFIIGFGLGQNETEEAPTFDEIGKKTFYPCFNKSCFIQHLNEKSEWWWKCETCIVRNNEIGRYTGTLRCSNCNAKHTLIGQCIYTHKLKKAR